MSDGSFNYKNSISGRDIAQVRGIAVAANVLKKQAYHPSPHLIQTFESFVRLLMSDGATVVFYLPPYHPAFFERINKSTDRLGPAERYMRGVASRYKIRLVGSYDPVQAGCGEEDFFDEGHMRDSGIYKIFGQEGSFSAAAAEHHGSGITRRR